MAFWKKGLIVAMVLTMVAVLGRLSGVAQGDWAEGRSLNPLRKAAADFFWLQAYGAWEDKSEDDFRYYSEMARWADPGRWFFVQETVGVWAYDLPVWRVGRSDVLDVEKRKQATAVLKWLDELEPQFGDDFRWHLERGFLQLHQLKDIAAARECFYAATKCSGAPEICTELYLSLEPDVQQ